MMTKTCPSEAAKKDIYYPCDLCYVKDDCRSTGGCCRWRAWFRAYWAELRRRYAKNHSGD